MPDNIRIRPATEADLPAVHALMYELAEYEKEPEAVFTTPQEYLEDFRSGLFESHVAEMDGRIVGMTLFYMAYSSWKGKMLYLDDFVVTESHRRFGVGQMLFDAFVEEGRNRGCRLVKWQVLDWNAPAIQFYKKYNSNFDGEWINCKLTFDQLQTM